MTDDRTILVVDDDRELAGVLTEFLEREGHRVVTRHTGAEALAALRGAPFTLLILDLRLPDLDGLALMREALRLPDAPEVVIVTGHATLESAVAAVEAGASGYVLKPFSLSHLAAVVGRAVERRGLARENARLSGELADRLAEAESMLEIASTIGSTLDLVEALRRICRALVRVTSADTAAAYLHDPARDLLVPAAAYHVPKDVLQIIVTESLALREQGFYLPVWSSRRAVYSDEVKQDARFSHELFRRIPHQSGLLLPLVLDDEVAGAFYLVWWKERRRFSDHDIAVLEQVSGQVAVLIRNAELYARADRDRRRLDTLYDVSRKLSALHDTDQILSMILDEATRLLGADGAGIRLLEGDALVVAAQTDSVAAMGGRPRIEMGQSLSGRVVVTARPLAVEDLAADTTVEPSLKQRPLDGAFRGFLGVPLRVQGRAIGALNVYTRGPRRYLPEEIALLSSFADHASLAIEKGRLLRDAEEGGQTFARLYQVAIAMQDSLDRADRIQAFLRAAHQVVGFDRVNVFLATDDGAELELVSAVGEGETAPPAKIPLSPGGGVYHQAFESRLPVAVLSDDALAAAPALAPAFREHAFFRTRRFVVVPLVVGERALGVVSADNKPSRRPIRPQGIEPFTLLCQQLAMALEQSRLYAETRLREREVTQLYEVTNLFAASLDLDRVLDVIVEKTAELLNADASIIFRLDEPRDCLVPWRSRNYDATLLNDVVLRVGEGLSGRAVRERRAVWSRDLHADASVRYGRPVEQAVRAMRIRASLAAPIISRGRVYAVVAVNRFVPHDFTQGEVRLLSALADQAAIAVENAALYAETRARARETGKLYEITGQLATSLDLDRLLELITTKTLELLECDASGIYTYDEAQAGLRFLRGLNLDPELTRDLLLKPGEGVAGRAFQEHRPAWTRDRLADVALGYSPDAESLIRAKAPRAYLAVPIVSRGQVLGVLVDYFFAPHDFTPREIQLLSTLADHAAIALENARLYAETRAREQEATRLYTGLAVLNQASRALYRTLDVEAMLQGALEELARAFGAGSALVNLVDDDGKTTDSIGHWLSDDHGRDAARHRRGGITGVLRRTRAPLLLRDIAERSDIVNAAHFAHGVRSLAAFPIVGQADRLCGVLLLYYTTPQTFPESEVQLLRAYAGQLATALENAQLYEEAQTQRTRLRLIFDSTSDGIVLLGRDGRVEAANRRAGEMLGFDATAVVGRGLAALLAGALGPGDHERTVSALRHLVQEPEGGGQGDLEVVRPARRVLHWIGQPTKNALRATIGLTLTFQDVTEEREVSQMKSDFVSFVTHQLRTPLAGIKWLLELAAQEDGLSPGVLSFVEDARQANERLIQLVNDLLNVSRLESGKLAVVPKPTDLGALTRSVVDEVAPLVREKDLRLTVEAESALPLVMGEPQFLRQMILNLTSNAIKYTPAGGRIDIRLGRADGRQVRWRIRDTGIGIPADGQRRLFEKFYRAENVRTVETEGTGLGLYLVRLIVELLGGRIGCESEEGQGSTFTVTLPAEG